jgi:hypothetical protein
MANLATEGPGTHGEPENRGLGESGQSEPAARSSDRRIAWSPEAERRLERIPEFIRPMVRQGIEKLAVQRGYRRITEDLMEEARGAFGM